MTTATPASTHATAMGAPDDLGYCPLMPTYGPPQVLFVRVHNAARSQGEPHLSPDCTPSGERPRQDSNLRTGLSHRTSPTCAHTRENVV